MELLIEEFTPEHLKRVTAIYNEGIEDRQATLEQAPKTVEEVEKWILGKSPRHKTIIAKKEDGLLLGFATLNVFNPRSCYDGVADFSIYIKRSYRGQGIGRALVRELEKIAKEQNFYKLVLSTPDHNETGKRLYQKAGFTLVGTYKNQGRIDGKWVDITLMEKML
jgi:L-amino acid N-acyltransferase YncA